MSSSVFKNIVVTIKAVDEASSVIEKQQVALMGVANVLTGLGPGFSQIGNVISGFAVGGPMGAAIAGIGDVVTGLKGCVTEAEKMQDTWNRLKVIVENSGTAWDVASSKIKTFIDSMMNLSKFSAADLGNALKVLVGYGMDLETAMQVMTATMDLATAKQVSLETAATAVGKAFSGQAGVLNRMGIVLDESVPKADRFNGAMHEIAEKFGGAAQKDIETYAGKMAQFQNKLSDVAEKIGNALIPILTKLAEGLIVVVDKVTWFIEQLTNAYNAVNNLFEGIKKGCEDAMKSIGDTLNSAGKGITDTFNGIYNALIGHSIWPKMWDEMIDVSARSMDRIRGQISGNLGTIQGSFSGLAGGSRFTPAT